MFRGLQMDARERLQRPLRRGYTRDGFAHVGLRHFVAVANARIRQNRTSPTRRHYVESAAGVFSRKRSASFGAGQGREERLTFRLSYLNVV